MKKNAIKICFAFCLLSICAGVASARGSDMMGEGWYGPYRGELCNVEKGRVSNRDGDTSMTVRARCGGKTVSGTLMDAAPFGDGASIEYTGTLSVDGRQTPAQAIVSLDSSGKSAGAVACGGIVFDIGEIWWD